MGIGRPTGYGFVSGSSDSWGFSHCATKYSRETAYLGGPRIATARVELSTIIMEFREFASNETSALLSRLLASGSGDTRNELKRLRAALDAAADAAEKALAQPVPLPADEVQALVERLATAANSDRDAFAERLRAEGHAAVDTVRKDLTLVQAALTE